MAHRTARIEELEDIAVAGVRLRPVRRPLGITAFGANAFSADAGERVIEEHDETGGSGAGGHEELYVVLTGHARFTLDGEQVDAPAGTLVFCGERDTRRGAVATADGTTVLVVGGPAGAAGAVSPWEWYFAATAYANRGDWRGAYDFAAQGLEAHPGHASLHYNLACYASMAGMRQEALEHLRRSIEGNPAMLARAQEDPDLDPVRDDPAFPRS